MFGCRKLGPTIAVALLAGFFAGPASAVNEKIVTWLTPESDTGQRHIIMYNMFGGASCGGCHINMSNNAFLLPPGEALTPPFLAFKGVDMHEGRSCVSCHDDGIFFLPNYLPMRLEVEVATGRCSDCHEVSKDRTEGKNSDKDKD